MTGQRRVPATPTLPSRPPEGPTALRGVARPGGDRRRHRGPAVPAALGPPHPEGGSGAWAEFRDAPARCGSPAHGRAPPRSAGARVAPGKARPPLPPGRRPAPGSPPWPGSRGAATAAAPGRHRRDSNLRSADAPAPRRRSPGTAGLPPAGLKGAAASRGAGGDGAKPFYLTGNPTPIPIDGGWETGPGTYRVVR